MLSAASGCLIAGVSYNCVCRVAQLRRAPLAGVGPGEHGTVRGGAAAEMGLEAPTKVVRVRPTYRMSDPRYGFARTQQQRRRALSPVPGEVSHRRQTCAGFE